MMQRANAWNDHDSKHAASDNLPRGLLVLQLSKLVDGLLSTGHLRNGVCAANVCD